MTFIPHSIPTHRDSHGGRIELQGLYGVAYEVPCDLTDIIARIVRSCQTSVNINVEYKDVDGGKLVVTAWTHAYREEKPGGDFLCVPYGGPLNISQSGKKLVCLDEKVQSVQ